MIRGHGLASLGEDRIAAGLAEFLSPKHARAASSTMDSLRDML